MSHYSQSVEVRNNDVVLTVKDLKTGETRERVWVGAAPYAQVDGGSLVISVPLSVSVRP